MSKYRLEITDIVPLKAGNGFIIKWHGSDGRGDYMIYMENGKIYGDSEYMDKNDNKKFLKLLLEKLIEEVEIIS